jgi:hypothetical protein
MSICATRPIISITVVSPVLERQKQRERERERDKDGKRGREREKVT